MKWLGVLKGLQLRTRFMCTVEILEIIVSEIIVSSEAPEWVLLSARKNENEDPSELLSFIV